LKNFAGIKLAIGNIGASELKMAFTADRKIVQLDEFRYTQHRGVFRQRLVNQPILSNPIPDDEDKTSAPYIDFAKEESMKVFREEKRNFADVLSRRVLYHLENWKINELGIFELLEKYLDQK
jgi:hypothetical protein